MQNPNNIYGNRAFAGGSTGAASAAAAAASPTPIFWNYALDKGKLKSFVSWFLKQHGEKKTLELLEQLKVLGFGYATEAGISLGIEDLKIPPQKPKMLAKAKSMVDKSRFLYRSGSITDLERTQGFMEVWNEVNETLKDEVVSYFQKTNILNPVYMMAFSGARGNLSQVRQLVGMRGLMSDPQGKIIDFPILSNFREGLTLTEYLISTYGARKGIVDTALRTATAGYLTRRLVDVAQHVVVSKMDCGTQRGIFLFDMKDGVKTIYSFQNRLIGRVLAQDIYSLPKPSPEAAALELRSPSPAAEPKPELPKLEKAILKIASKNQEVNEDLASKIAKVTKRALVRSPLTCEHIKRVCQLCYGWSLATSRLVSIGEAVGVIAGQSIGEPGTQLTMRTFHTGGVFAGNITEQINAPFDCLVEYSHPMAGSLLRISIAKNNCGNGKPLAFLTKSGGNMILKQSAASGAAAAAEPKPKPRQSYARRSASSASETARSSNVVKTYKLPPFTILFARHGEWIPNSSVLAQISSASAAAVGQKATQTSEQTVYTSLEGEVFYSHLDLMEDIDPKYGERVSKSEDWAKVWVLSAKIFQTPIQKHASMLKNSLEESSQIFNYFPKVKDFISKNTIVQEIEWVSPLGSFVETGKLNKTGRFFPPSLAKTPLPSGMKILTRNESENGKLKNSCQIFQNYKIRSILSPNNHFMNLTLARSAVGFAFAGGSGGVEADGATSSSGSNFKLTPTFLSYKWNKNKAFKVSVLLKNAQVFLPIQEQGTLYTWLCMFAPKVPRRKTKKILQNLGESSRVLFLPLKNKFRQKTKVNYAQPLILTNQIPCVLESKTFASFKEKAKGSLQNNLSLFNVSSTKNLHFKENIKKAFVYKTKRLSFREKEPQLTFRSHSNTHTVKKLSLKKENLKNQNLHSGKNTDPGFQDLFMKEQLLSFPAVDARYNKLGYSASANVSENTKNSKDVFFSYLPLKFESFYMSKAMRSNNNPKQNLPGLKYNSNAALFQSQKLDKSILKNTNCWQPKPNMGFAWYPSAHQIPESCLCLVRSPANEFSFFQQLIVEKMKNLKEARLWQQKALNILNLSQSQICKTKKRKNKGLKNSLKNLKLRKLKPVHLTNQKPMWKQRRAEPRLRRSRSRTRCAQNLNSLLGFKLPVYKFQAVSQKQSIPKETVLKKFQENTLKNQKSFKLFYNSLYYKKFDLKNKQNSTTNAQQDANTPKRLTNKVGLSLLKQRNTDSKKTYSSTSTKKKVKKAKSKKHKANSPDKRLTIKQLQIVLNQNQKKNLSFTEIFYVPQKNYLIENSVSSSVYKNVSNKHEDRNMKAYNNNVFMKKKQFFYSPESIQNSKNLNFVLTNYQGLKRKFNFSEGTEQRDFKREGVLTMRSFKESKKQRKGKWMPQFFMHWNNSGAEVDVGSVLSVPLPTILRQKIQSPNFEVLKLKFLKHLISKYANNSLSLKEFKGNTKKETPLHLVFNKNQRKCFSYLPLFQGLSAAAAPLTIAHKESNGGYNTEKTNLNLMNLNYTKTGTGEHTFKAPQLDKLEVTFKSGWIYATQNPKYFFSKNKKVQDFGNPLMDDIHFESQKILLEPLKLEKSEKNEEPNPPKKQNKPDFVPSKWLRNKKCRFFKVPEVPPLGRELGLRDSGQSGTPSDQNSTNGANLDPEIRFPLDPSLHSSGASSGSGSGGAEAEGNSVENSFSSKPFKPLQIFYLIRPFECKKVCSNEEMKTLLYEKMKKSEKFESGKSYELYKNYFSQNLNPQTNQNLFLGSFPKVDLMLEPVSVFPKPKVKDWLQSFKTKKRKKREKTPPRKAKNPTSNTKNVKTGKLVQNKQNKQRNRKSPREIRRVLQKAKKKKFMDKLRGFLGFTLSKKRIVNKTFNGIVVLKGKKDKSLSFYKKIHHAFYFSNQSLNVSPYRISYKLRNSEWHAYCFPKISLNYEPNTLGLSKSKNKEQGAFITESLKLMLKRRTENAALQRALNSNIIELKPSLLFGSSKSKQDHNFNMNHRSTKNQLVKGRTWGRKGGKFETSNSMLQYFYCVPKFEFSVSMHYSFFMNARLRSSGSWKQSFEESLNSNFLNTYALKNENFRVQRILKKKGNKSLISVQNLPTYKNVLNSNKNNSLSQQQKAVGFTRFYSPFEGLVLKDYEFETNLENLKKTFNVNLDEVLLRERQGQKLILTKDDLFSLNLATLPNEDTFGLNKPTRANLNVSGNGPENPTTRDFALLEKKFSNFDEKQAFFQKISKEDSFKKILTFNQKFQKLENFYVQTSSLESYNVSNFSATHNNKTYKLNQVTFEMSEKPATFRIGKFSHAGDSLYGDYCLPRAGQVIHLNGQKVTFRKAEYFALLPRAILHTYNGHTIQRNNPVMTLPFETLNSGDIVQGIPKVEQYLEARTTIQGRLFLNSLPVLLYAIYRRYLSTLEMDKAARQSFLKIQQILVDGVQRVYRSQGVGITDKHLEVIVRQMTSKVKIIYGGQTGFFPGELVDLDLVERVNKSLVVKVVYEPVVLGITRASLEVDSFLSAASFQQTTKVLTRAALENKKDFLKGLKENLLVGNLLPAGTGYVVPIANFK